MAPDPIALGDLAADVAREAGIYVRGRAGDVRLAVSTKSTVTDMVTEVDRASEALIVARLLDARPDDGILGEEGAARDGTSGVRWVIDPLDGTTNFLYGFPAYAVSIAAELDGETIAGAVFDAVHGELFAAAKDAGAALDGRPIRVSTKDELATALVGTGFGYRPERRAWQAKITSQVLPLVRDIRRGGSAALDHCWVACGRLDAYYEQGVQRWDTAAGALVVREAGGATDGIDEGPLAGLRIAAAPALLAPLRALLVAAAG